MSSPATPSLESIRATLEKHEQSHLLRFWDQLDGAGQARLLSQLAEIDFPQLDSLVQHQEQAVDFAGLASRGVAPPAVKADGTGAAWSVDDAIAKGREALAAGQVAAVIVAGGQGTRLGFDKPKGMFPIGPVSERTLFQIFADRLLALEAIYQTTIPLYLMTSPATHEPTVAYFEAHDWLGLGKDDVKIFCQGTMPAVDDATGKVLLADRDQIALSPDGHGGTVRALVRSGCLQDANERGIKYLSYVQVDNPLVQLCDPALIGHHIAAGSQLTSQVVRKRYPTEKVGNVVLADGRVQVIEYSDLPVAAAERTDEEGNLVLWAGSIAVHVFDVDFVEAMSRRAEVLPFHRAHKKVPHLDDSGQRVAPESPNAIKFERFIFDLLPYAENAFVVEGRPAEVFAPVKNADGAENDTPELARQAIVQQAKRKLAEVGIEVAEGVQVELHPQFAMQPEALKAKLGETSRIERDTYIC